MKAALISLIAQILFDLQENRILEIVAGNFQVVPNNEVWEVNAVFISENRAVSIKIPDSYFKAKYESGDTINTPLYIPEMELLNSKSTVFYKFYLDSHP
jgi:hypothetical protein